MGLETRRPSRMARALEGQSQPLSCLVDLLSCLVDAVLLLLLRLWLGRWGHWAPDWGWVLSHMRGEGKGANASRFQGTRIVLKTFCSSVMTFKHLLSVFALHDTQSLLLRYWWWHVWIRAWGGPPRQVGLPESTNLQNKCTAKDGGQAGCLGPGVRFLGVHWDAPHLAHR